MKIMLISPPTDSVVKRVVGTTGPQSLTKMIHFTREQISRALEVAYVRFYFRPKVLIKDVIQDKGFIIKRTIPQLIKIYAHKLNLDSAPSKEAIQ